MSPVTFCIKNSEAVVEIQCFISNAKSALSSCSLHMFRLFTCLHNPAGMTQRSIWCSLVWLAFCSHSPPTARHTAFAVATETSVIFHKRTTPSRHPCWLELHSTECPVHWKTQSAQKIL